MLRHAYCCSIHHSSFRTSPWIPSYLTVTHSSIHPPFMLPPPPKKPSLTPPSSHPHTPIKPPSHPYQTTLTPPSNHPQTFSSTLPQSPFSPPLTPTLTLTLIFYSTHPPPSHPDPYSYTHHLFSLILLPLILILTPT